MIITCPECATRFMLDDADMPEDGRKVRCSRCSHVWHEDAPAAPVEQALPLVDTPDSEPAPDEPATPPAAETTPQLEAKAPESSETGGNKALVWILVILAVIGAGIAGFAVLMPNEFDKLIGGTSKPAKPAVVTTPGMVNTPAPEAPIEEPAVEAAPDAAPTSEAAPLPDAAPASESEPPTLPVDDEFGFSEEPDIDGADTLPLPPPVE